MRKLSPVAGKGSTSISLYPRKAGRELTGYARILNEGRIFAYLHGELQSVHVKFLIRKRDVSKPHAYLLCLD